jgi:hypothetical protein
MPVGYSNIKNSLAKKSDADPRLANKLPTSLPIDGKGENPVGGTNCGLQGVINILLDILASHLVHLGNSLGTDF